MTYAKVIADSISASGHRVTTFEVCFHRFVLAEFNTHRTFSRNSASSRAIPVGKQIERLWKSPAYPLSWPKEQKGMQGGEEFSTADALEVKQEWIAAMHDAVSHVGVLHLKGLHKSVTNRLLEPFMWHTVVVTATAWENFFAQRCSPLAQPEIRVAAEMMREAYEASEPVRLVDGEWHVPYVGREDTDLILDYLRDHGVEEPTPGDILNLVPMISAARCARVSYLTQDGKRDIAADLNLYDRLVNANPPHWSPLEHVATPDANNSQYGRSYSFHNKRLDRWETVTLAHLPVVGNLLGWRSLRTEVEAEKGIKTFV